MNSFGRRMIANLAALSVLLGALLLLRFPPSVFPFYPRCPINFWLHLECPGCGATRAMAALLSGHLQEALRRNAMIVVSTPLAAAYLGLSYWRAMRDTPFSWPAISNRWLAACLVVVSFFTVIRNLHGS